MQEKIYASKGKVPSLRSGERPYFSRLAWGGGTSSTREREDGGNQQTRVDHLTTRNEGRCFSLLLDEKEGNSTHTPISSKRNPRFTDRRERKKESGDGCSPHFPSERTSLMLREKTGQGTQEMAGNFKKKFPLRILPPARSELNPPDDQEERGEGKGDTAPVGSHS